MKSNPKEKIGLILDMDGTIFAVPTTFFITLNEILREVVYKLSNQQKLITNGDIHDFWLSGRDFDKVLLKWGIKDTILFWEEFDEQDYIERKKMIENKEVYVFPDAKEIIETLPRYPQIKTAIISNTPPKIANMQFSLFNLDVNSFDQTYFLGSVEQIYAKPSPVKIQEFMQIHGLTPDVVYIVGDTNLDVVAGKNAGIKTIFVRRKHNQDHELDLPPDFEITDLNDIFKIIRV